MVGHTRKIMKIMFIAHESEMNGASKSLLNLISFFKQYSEIFVVVSKGDYNSTGETNKKDTEKDNGKEDKKDESK